jgi:class 3 adenylate cyclase
MASRIPTSRLVVRQSQPSSLAYTFADDVVSSVTDFIDEVTGGTEAAVAPNVSEPPGAFRAILFTDVKDSTLLTAEHGDAKARELLQEHERLTREALAAHASDEIKTMGDGFMVASASDYTSGPCCSSQ